MEGDEVWLVGANIAEYSYSHALNHVPKRRRKLLMHRREIRKFAGQAFEKGLTLVPLKMYFKEGRAKVLLGICRGKQKHDKRDSMKKREIEARHRPGDAAEVDRGDAGDREMRETGSRLSTCESPRLLPLRVSALCRCHHATAPQSPPPPPGPSCCGSASTNAGRSVGCNSVTTFTGHSGSGVS